MNNLEFYLATITLIFLDILTHNYHTTIRADGLCCQVKNEMKTCSNLTKFRLSQTKSYGYDFAIGSLKDADAICQPDQKSIIDLYECIGDVCQKKCHNNKLLKYFYQNIFETRGLKRATKYLCENIYLFRKHKDGCLLRLEQEATKCNQPQESKDFMKLVSQGLKYEHDIKERIRVILNNDRCNRLIRKIECLESLLKRECPPQVVALIANYFKETRTSDDCVIQSSSKSSLIQVLDSRNTDFSYTKSLLKQKSQYASVQTKIIQNDVPSYERKLPNASFRTKQSYVKSLLILSWLINFPTLSNILNM